MARINTFFFSCHSQKAFPGRQFWQQLLGLNKWIFALDPMGYVFIDTLFCSVINAISVNRTHTFKSLHILLPLSPCVPYLECVFRWSKDQKEKKQRPEAEKSKALNLRDTPAQGNPPSDWDLTWGNLAGSPKGLFPNVVMPSRESILLEDANVETRRWTALDRTLYPESLSIIFTVKLPSPRCPCNKATLALRHEPTSSSWTGPQPCNMTTTHHDSRTGASSWWLDAFATLPVPLSWKAKLTAVHAAR